MRQPMRASIAERDLALGDLDLPLALDRLVPGGEVFWEVELGFGKGKYLLQRAQEAPERRFLGVEVVSKYSRMLVARARRRGLRNLFVFRGEAVFLMSAVLPPGFAEAVHVYFPDPWPKSRHHKRRLFDPERIDLVLGLLKPGGRLYFATDFLEYGERVRSLLDSHPALSLEIVEGVWPGGARTNYEAKYIEEGRPILRLVAKVEKASCPPYFHPQGAAGVLAANAPKLEE
ncbi:MAG: tRNA (guanosine(46)-N7)-methyltransferase TrmB [Acidobacteria bacterium]|nr:tRNA (guanosine(46)-N7)-methyltransferase TrmB [Acidobacteriota bacterium]